jgi:putative transposase
VGIEVDYLFYNSPTLTDLRRRLGENLDVEIRVDDANLGKIIVLAPDTGEPIEARAINSQYAEGLSRWQHKVCRRFAHQHRGRESRTASDSPEAYLEAKLQIAERIREGFLTGHLSGKRVARYLSSEQSSGTAAGDISESGTSEAAKPPHSIANDPPPAAAAQQSVVPVDSQIESLAPVRPKTFGAMRRNRTAQTNAEKQQETDSCVR